MDIRTKFTQEMCNLSSSIATYIEEQEYVADLESNDCVNDITIFNLVFNKVEQELEAMGILNHCDSGKYVDHDTISAVMDIRKIYDTNHFRNLLNNDRELRDHVVEMLSSDEYDFDTFIVNLSSYLAERYDLDPKYSNVNEMIHLFTNTRFFNDHISAICDMTLEQVETKTDSFSRYTELMLKQAEQIKSVYFFALGDQQDASFIEQITSLILNNIDKNFVDFYLDSFDTKDVMNIDGSEAEQDTKIKGHLWFSNIRDNHLHDLLKKTKSLGYIGSLTKDSTQMDVNKVACSMCGIDRINVRMMNPSKRALVRANMQNNIKNMENICTYLGIENSIKEQVKTAMQNIKEI